MSLKLSKHLILQFFLSKIPFAKSSFETWKVLGKSKIYIGEIDFFLCLISLYMKNIKENQNLIKILHIFLNFLSPYMIEKNK